MLLLDGAADLAALRDVGPSALVAISILAFMEAIKAFAPLFKNGNGKPSSTPDDTREALRRIEHQLVEVTRQQAETHADTKADRNEIRAREEQGREVLHRIELELARQGRTRE